MPAKNDKFVDIIGEVAGRLSSQGRIGQFNKERSRGSEERYGSNGSISVNVEKGVFSDFEHVEDNGRPRTGGTLDLVMQALGCERKEALDWLVEERLIEPAEAQGGTPPADLRRERNKRSNASRERAIGTPRTEVAVYHYHDEDGTYLFEVVRYEPKQFSQRRWDGDSLVHGITAGPYVRKGRGGEWYPAKPADKDTRTFDAVETVPYRLPQVLAAIASGERIVILEGEKDVDRSWKEGQPATCNPMGAGKWREEWGSFFAGADVVCVPDNDDGGRSHMQRVAYSIEPHATRVAVSEPLPGVPPKGDLSDFLDAGRSFDEFLTFIDNVPRWRPSRPVTRWPTLTADDIDKPGLEHEWLIQGVIAKREVATLIGQSGSAKTFLALHMSLAIARGEPCLRRPVEQGLVIYQLGEGETGIKDRQKAYRQRNGVSPEEWADIPIVTIPKRISLFASDDDKNEIVKIARDFEVYYRQKTALVVIDTLNKAIRGAEETSGKDMGLVLDRAQSIAEELGCAVLLLHHTPKGSTTARGHGSVLGDVETELYVEVLEGVLDRDSRKVRRVTIRKQKEGEPPEPVDFVLYPVEIGIDRYGHTKFAVAVAQPNREEDHATNAVRLSQNRELYFRALLQALEKDGRLVPEGVPAPIGTVCVTRDKWQEHALPMSPETGTEAQRKDNVRKNVGNMIAAFQNIGVIKHFHPYVWLTGRIVANYMDRQAKIASTGKYVAEEIKGQKVGKDTENEED